GFVSYAGDLGSHVAQLEAALMAPPSAEGIQSFVGEFLRPHGDEPVAPLLARMVAERAATAVAGRTPGSGLRASELEQPGAVAPRAGPGESPSPSSDAAPGPSTEIDSPPAATRRLRLAPGSAAT